MSIRRSRVYMAPVPKMPLGLVELMENLAKDVLKNNPTDVYAFCADHMKKLLDIRDFPTPKSVLTLEQKIAIAQKKVKERAARRNEDYDKAKTSHYQSRALMEEINEVKRINTDSNDAEQYDSKKIIKLSEDDLPGNIEHEIVVITDEKALKESMDKPEMETGDKGFEIYTREDDKQDSVNSESDKGKSDNNENSMVSQTNYEENVAAVEEIKEIAHHETKLKTELENPENKDIDEVKIDNELTTSQHLSDSSKEDDIQDKTNKTLYIEEAKPDANIVNGINNSDSIINVTIFVADRKDIQEVAKEKPSSISDPVNETLTAADTDTADTFSSSSNTDHDKTENNKLVENRAVDAYNQNDKSVHEISDLPEKNDTKLKFNMSQNEVNDTSMDLETAAITIQKVFRSFLFRNKTLSADEPTNVDIHLLIEDKENEIDNDGSSKDRRGLGLNRMDTVLQTVNEEKSLSLSTEDSSTLSSAATIIQAHVRGFLVRNKFNVNKNSSTTSGVDSEGLSINSLEVDNEQKKNKTILNIHIVPENGHFISRDESVLTSMDLSLDGSPTSSTNLHPLGHDTIERRKQLKREDAIQSISPPSNNSGKLSEDMDSVKEILIKGETNTSVNQDNKDVDSGILDDSVSTTKLELNDDNISTMVNNDDIALEVKSLGPVDSPVKYSTRRPQSLPEIASDEMDVITPYTPVDEKKKHFENDSKLLHSGEFHDVVLPTKVSRNDTSVVRGE